MGKILFGFLVIVLAQHGQLFLLDLRDMTLVKEDGIARDSDSETPNINVIQFSEGGFTILALDKVMRTGTDRQRSCYLALVNRVKGVNYITRWPKWFRAGINQQADNTFNTSYLAWSVLEVIM